MILQAKNKQRAFDNLQKIRAENIPDPFRKNKDHIQLFPAPCGD